jgi:hypothetical protein
MNLEAELRALPIDWPQTPQFELGLALAPPRRRRRWPLAVAIAVAAIAAALAVPESRGAILRFFHLGGVTIQVVDTLPHADERPLTAGLGPVISTASAKRVIPALLLPPVDTPPPLHYTQGNVVSTVFEHLGQPVLLSEFPGGGGYLKKLASGGSRVEGAHVGTAPGLWVSGARHVAFFAGQSPRLAGNVLLWEADGATYRLEGPNLSKVDAISLAQSLRRG